MSRSARTCVGRVLAIPSLGRSLASHFPAQSSLLRRGFDFRAVTRAPQILDEDRADEPGARTRRGTANGRREGAREHAKEGRGVVRIEDRFPQTGTGIW